MDTRDTAEQAELRRSARQLARELAPATVADLDDEPRAKRLAAAVHDAGWLELRDDTGSGAPLASAVEAAIVADALGGSVADVAFTGPVLARDLARRAGIEPVEHAVVAFTPSLLDAAPRRPAYAVDVPAEGDAAVFVVGSELARARVEGAGRGGSDLTRAVVACADGTSAEVLGGHLGDDDLVAWHALGLALTSADLVGVMRGVLDLTVAYAAERRQFGVAVGSFQAVQHLLAEARCLQEGSLSAALYAAWAVDALEPTDALAAGRVAKAYAARAARTVCETAVQVHGGIGNTWDCMAHVYLRRALLSSQWFGDDAVQLEQIGSR